MKLKRVIKHAKEDLVQTIRVSRFPNKGGKKSK